MRHTDQCAVVRGLHRAAGDARTLVAYAMNPRTSAFWSTTDITTQYNSVVSTWSSAARQPQSTIECWLPCWRPSIEIMPQHSIVDCSLDPSSALCHPQHSSSTQTKSTVHVRVDGANTCRAIARLRSSHIPAAPEDHLRHFTAFNRSSAPDALRNASQDASAVAPESVGWFSNPLMA